MSKYLKKPYIQALIVGTVTIVIYYLLNKKNDNDKQNLNMVNLLKVFLSTTISSLAVIYLSNTKMNVTKSLMSGGGTNVTNTQNIMTGKPQF